MHPDSGHPDASAEKFTELDNAFRILQSKFAKERRGIQVEDDGAKEFDIKVSAVGVAGDIYWSPLNWVNVQF